MSAMDVIKVDPEIMHGTPCFAGTRVPVRTLFDYLQGNHPIEEFLDDFPTVTRKQVKEVLEMAVEKVLPLAVSR